MMNKSEWKKVKLEECADINMGQSPISSSYNIDGNGIPFYQGNADFGELYPKLRYYCSKPIKVANEEDLLLSVRAPIGKINIAKTSCCIGRGLCAITPKKDIVLQKYLYYILKYKENEFNLKGTGSTFKAINKKQISETMFLLPDINIQKNIILKLENSEKLLKLKKEQLSELEKLVKFQFLKMFGDPILNEKNWKICYLNNISENLDAERIPITAKNRNKGKIPYYGASGIIDYVENYIFNENLLLISEDGANLLTRVLPIAFSVTGKIWVNNHAHVLRFYNSYTQTYIEYLLNMMDISNYITGTAQPKLNQAKLNEILIPFPPIELQNKFAEFVKQVDKSKVELQKSIDETQLLFDSLMDKYFG